MKADSRITTLASIARELGAERIEREVRALEERLVEGRFYVACVGQFKRGKSTLLNALVSAAVLPVGVVPVTAIVTVMRYGDATRARVRFAEGEWRDVEPSALAAYVSEAENPDNEKNVAGVEVFVPSELLRSGLCLVDTPGLGSVFASNTEATRAFVPHIDAALVVLGADPPISGAELDLVAEVSQKIDRLVFALNKSDKLADAERAEGRAFAEGVLRKRLGRDVAAIFEVSALERMKGNVTRDWTALERTLADLGTASAEVVRDAERRGVARIAAQLEREIEEQRSALLRPREESEKRIGLLRKGVENADAALREMEYLFLSVQDGLKKMFDAERQAFVARALPVAIEELTQFVDASGDSRKAAANAVSRAEAIARAAIERFRDESAPVAESLYRRAVTRFVEMAREILATVAAASHDEALAGRSFDPDAGFRVRSHFYFTDMLAIAGPSAGARLGSLGAIKKHATEYITRLFETNSARAVNDFADRVLESRRRVQGEMREHLQAVLASAEAAVARAQTLQTQGKQAVDRELTKLDAVAHDLSASQVVAARPH